MTKDETELIRLTNDFYQDLYKSEGPVTMQSVIDVIPRKVTTAMNDNLVAQFTREEVKAALF